MSEIIKHLKTIRETVVEALVFLENNFPSLVTIDFIKGTEKGQEAGEVWAKLRDAQLLIRYLEIAIEMDEAGAPYKMLLYREEETK